MSEQIKAEDFGDYLADVGRDLSHKSFQPVMEEAVPILRQSVRDNFNSSANPEDEPWLERKNIGDGHPLLMDTGNLVQAATGGGPGAIAKVEERSVGVGVDLDIVPYARRHNKGDEPGKGPMPQREFLGAKEEHLQEVGELIADHAVEQIF